MRTWRALPMREERATTVKPATANHCPASSSKPAEASYVKRNSKAKVRKSKRRRIRWTVQPALRSSPLLSPRRPSFKQEGCSEPSSKQVTCHKSYTVDISHLFCDFRGPRVTLGRQRGRGSPRAMTFLRSWHGSSVGGAAEDVVDTQNPECMVSPLVAGKSGGLRP